MQQIAGYQAKGDVVLSGFCYVLNYLTNSDLEKPPAYIIFFPFLFVLIPLCTVDKDYWNRIKNKRLIAPLFLLDFVNYPTTAVITIGSFVLSGIIGYLHRFCALNY